jgi:hypothetical protein
MATSSNAETTRATGGSAGSGQRRGASRGIDVAAQSVRVGSDPTRWRGWVAVPAVGVAVRLVRAGGGWTRHGGGRAAVPVAGVTGLGGGSRV